MNNILHLSSNVEAYGHPKDYVLDELIILDVILELEMAHIRALQHSITDSYQPLHGMYMSDGEARLLLNNDEVYARHTSEQQLLLEQLALRIEARLQRSRDEGRRLPVHALQDYFQLTAAELRSLIAAVAPHVQRKYLKLYGYVQDDMTCQQVTLDLLLRICCRSEEERAELFQSMTAPEGSLRTFFTAGGTAQPMPEASLLTEPIRLKPRMISFLLGLEWRFEGSLASLKQYSQGDHEELPPLLIHEEIYRSIARSLRASAEQAPAIWLLQGPPGSGKTLQARYVCKEQGRSLLEYDLSHAPLELSEFKHTMEQLLLEAKLQHAIPAFDQVEKIIVMPEAGVRPDYRLTWLLERLIAWKDAAFLFSSESVKLPGFHTYIPIDIPLPDIDQSCRLWQAMMKPWRALSTDDSFRLAGKFRFTPGQIAAAVDAAKRAERWHAVRNGDHGASVSDSALLHQAAYGIISHGLQHKAVKVESKFSWDDLILPNETIGLLRQACNRIKDRHKVMHSWGFDRILPYGRGISMMFTGPPGTGKTMSALVMAKEMEAELYRVDLSRIVSKYIGETEKNLSDIFDHARQSGAILFFDEADSLFGKRSEVKDAHDKYANMETSYLLQKMEEYDGLTILATNFAQNLDDAFTRRIQFIIKYPFPDAVQREQLWRSSIPAEVPAGDIDYSFLSQTFELSGGPIKNIIITAAYMAANEGTPLNMKHMVEAAIQEYKKTGKVLLKDCLGPYSEYWRG